MDGDDSTEGEIDSEKMRVGNDRMTVISEVKKLSLSPERPRQREREREKPCVRERERDRDTVCER